MDNIPDSLEMTHRDNSGEIALQREVESVARRAEETRISEIRESFVSNEVIPEEPHVQFKIETLVID